METQKVRLNNIEDIDLTDVQILITNSYNNKFIDDVNIRFVEVSVDSETNQIVEFKFNPIVYLSNDKSLKLEITSKENKSEIKLKEQNDIEEGSTKTDKEFENTQKGFLGLGLRFLIANVEQNINSKGKLYNNILFETLMIAIINLKQDE